MNVKGYAVAVLVVVEALIAFVAVYFAVCVRFQTPFSHMQLLEAEIGPLWPRALLFSLIVVVCLMAFGLYKPPPGGPGAPGVLVRVVAALIVASCAVAALFYLVPSLKLWRGVEAIAVLATCAGIVLSRLAFAWWSNR